jgi:TolB-like protein
MVEGVEEETAGANRPTIFVSYASQDAPLANAVVGVLERTGVACWIAPRDVVPGTLYASEIVRAINECQIVVLVLSAQSVASPNVGKELERASSKRRRIIALRTDAGALPGAFEYFLSESQWIDAQTGGIEQAAAKLVEAVRHHQGSSQKLPTDDLQTVAAARKAPITADSPSERVASIAVLPFANMSNDPEQEYFSDGITEDIITDLSKVSSLSVIARNTAFTFKGKHVDIPAVAKQLKVNHVLEGSVRKSGNRVRITGQLIDGINGDHLWAERYDRNLDDIFALQDEISQAIVKALKLKLFPEEKNAIEARGTNNIEAYDIYLRAQDLTRQFGIDQSQRAIALYRRAVELDPQFALAWAGLGIACTNIVIRIPQSAKAAFQEMDQAFLQTAAAAPGTALGHTANGFRLAAHHDWLRADAAYTTARDLGSAREMSGLPGGSEYTFFLSHVGRFEEAVQVALGNLTWDPLSLSVSATSQYMLDGAGRHAEAEAEYVRSFDLTGDRTTTDYWALLRAWECGTPEQVSERTCTHLSGSARLFSFYPDLARVLDRHEAALAIIRTACSDPAYQDASRLSILAHWAARYGDTELAHAALRRAYVDLRGITVGNIWFPIQKPTRCLPAFRQLVRDLGLFDYWRRSGHWGDFARAKGADDFEIIK